MSDVTAETVSTAPPAPLPPSSEPEAVAPACKIKVENFYGPLDLLLHLVKEAEVDITRVSLVQVTAQYIAFLEAMQKLDLEIAGDFLVVASQLLLIKSRTLVPAEIGAEEEPEEDEDPSLDLIRRLLEYKIFKDRARALADREEERSRRFGRPRFRLEGEAPAEEPLRDMDLWGLVLSWSRLSKATRLEVSLDILYHNIPIELFMNRVMEALRGRRDLSFRDLIADPADRASVIGTFLAVLELMKEQRITVEQSVDGGEIRILSA